LVGVIIEFGITIYNGFGYVITIEIDIKFGFRITLDLEL